MLKYLLLIFLIVQAISCKAQLKEITGLVVFNNERTGAVIVKDISAHTQSLSNERGEFKLQAATGDTLITKKTDFLNDTIVMADQQELVIQLHKQAFILKTVVVSSTRVTPEATYEQNKKDYKDIYVKGDKSNMISIPLGLQGLLGAGIVLNLNKLYSAVSKEGKDARRLQKNFSTDYRNSIVDKRFNPLAAQITGYKDQKLKDFIMYNRPSYEMVARSSDYDLVQYIKQKLKQTGK